MARDYIRIKAWQLADELALLVYNATKEFPKSEIWGLTSQMRRAAVLVPGNIVEGSARKNRNEYLQFFVYRYVIVDRIELLHQVYKRVGIFNRR
jgi:four helix bundle protein